MSTSDTGVNTPLDEVCPESGFPIYCKPEWLDVSFRKESNYNITTKLIGDNILLVKSCGFGYLEDLQPALEFTKTIIDEKFPDGTKYVRMEDLTDFKGISSDARAHYASVMAKNEPLLGLIYFNVPYLLKTSIYLGMKFGLVPFSVQLASTYNDAMLRAMRLLKKI